MASDSRPLVQFTLNGIDQVAPAGISVAAAVLSITQTSRYSPLSGDKRGPYCMMGVCFDCLMEIDGEPNQQTCQMILKKGMQIATQKGVARLNLESPADDE